MRKIEVATRLQQPIACAHSTYASILILFLACVFAVRCQAQTVTDLHAFTFGSDGASPNAPAVGPDGSIYGTTGSGGNLGACSGGCGTVYRLTPSNGTWTFSTLYEFEGLTDGQGSGTLALDSSGNLYGVTGSGPNFLGVYRLTPGATGQPWNFELIYQFPSGSWVLSPVFIDGSGAVYGASLLGGRNGSGCTGCGFVFQLVPPNSNQSTWTENDIFEFPGGGAGGNPLSITMDSTGTIYGTTSTGGLGTGTIFQLLPVNGSWVYKNLHTFSTNHQDLNGTLIEDASGNLYGIVSDYPFTYSGDIFQISPPIGGTGKRVITYVHDYFTGYKATGLALAPDGTVYGCIRGDDSNAGYIFQVTPPVSQGGHWPYATLVSFGLPPYTYANPVGVVVGLQGYLYAVLQNGLNSGGAVLSIVP
jgi:uncharacterized repeat protein (TIGR03803 family)